MATDPNHPIDDSGSDYIFGKDPALSGHVPSEASVDTDMTFATRALANPSFVGPINSQDTSLSPTNAPDTSAWDAGYDAGNQELTTASGAQLTALQPNTDDGRRVYNYTGSHGGSVAFNYLEGDTTYVYGGTYSTAKGEYLGTPLNDTGSNAWFGAAPTSAPHTPVTDVLDTTQTGGYRDVSANTKWGAATTPEGIVPVVTGLYGSFYGQSNYDPANPTSAPGAFQVLDTTNTSNPTNAGYTTDLSASALVPTSYNVGITDTLYGYPGLTAGATGTGPGAPQAVSWTFAQDSALVTFKAPVSDGGNSINEYIVAGWQVRANSNIPTDDTTANAGFVIPNVITHNRKTKPSRILATPTGVATATATTGGSLVAGTYSYRVAALDATGSTLAATGVTKVVPAGTATNIVTVTWAAVTGASSYKVYGRTGGSELLIGTVTAPTLTFTDTGSVTPAGALPVANTSGSTATVRVEQLTPGEHYFFRVYARNDVGNGAYSTVVGISLPTSPNDIPKYSMGGGQSSAVEAGLAEDTYLTLDSTYGGY